MQILRSTLNFHEEVAIASEAIGDARLALAQPVVVRNANIIHLQKGRVKTYSSVLRSTSTVDDYSIINLHV